MQVKWLKYWCLVAIALQSLHCYAQEKPPRLSFLTDSLHVGQPVKASLVFKHGLNTQVLFPDTTYNFNGFQAIAKAWYPTVSDSLTSTDSVVYTLLTFRLDSAQALRLPVFIVSSGDSLALYSNTATFHLKHLVNSGSKGRLLSDVTFRRVSHQLNYPLYSAIAAGLLVVLLVFNFFFGRPVQRLFNRLLLYRRHRIFLLNFERLAAQTQREQSPQKLEAALNLWKKYVERVDGRPFSTYTTRDIIKLMPNEESLKNTLQTIDRCVYGGQANLISADIFQVLRRFSLRFYTLRREAIRNA